MRSRWKDDEAARYEGDELGLRAYTSRLLGADEDLVLHGGGNTSLKAVAHDFAGEAIPTLWVKGSGWDLATIEPAGFAGVRMKTLLAMGEREQLSDSDMVKHQRAAMLDPDAPLPSIEAVLHALIPLPWVDHTHADAVVTLSNAPHGEERLRSIYGDRVFYVPYVMPGFDLARAVRKVLAGHDARRYEGMILLHHGVFSWGDTARQSYERMIRLVDDAEAALERLGAWDVLAVSEPAPADDPQADAALGELRRLVSAAAGGAMVARVDGSGEAVGFADLPGVRAIATRGPVTPDHVIRTKRVPLVIAPAEDLAPQVDEYVAAYRAYHDRHARPGDLMLDPAPRWAVWPGRGVVAFGRTVKDADVVLDLARHTLRCIQRGEALGEWRALSEGLIHQMEYWELEQRKLRTKTQSPPLQGKVAVVTGAAHGIGRAVVARLRELGAAVVGLDRDPVIAQIAAGPDYLGLPCDVTERRAVDEGVAAAVRTFGGVDLLVSNAGAFPAAAPLCALSDEHWDETLDLNLDSHLKVLRATAPHLQRGVEPAVVVVASKNVLAPGPGVAAYSVAKAGLTQLARVAALELGEHGVRVNVVHPDAVFDTRVWSPAMIESRAKAYGLTPEAYKRRNILKREVRSRDVANAVAWLLSPESGLTTGAQVPVDGGNIRVI